MGGRTRIICLAGLLVATAPSAVVAAPGGPSVSGPTAAAPTRVLVGMFDWGTSTDMALDAAGHRHVVATRADGDLWYATDRSGRWISKRLLRGDDGRMAWTDPSIVVDEHGRVHVAAVQSSVWETPSSTGGIWYLTDRGRSRGDFGPRTRLAGRMAADPSLRVVDGVRYLAYGRCACSPGDTDAPLFFKTDRSGRWTRERIADYGRTPSLRVRQDGRPTIAYRGRQGVRVVTGRTRLGDFSKPVRIPGSGGVMGEPSLALVGKGQPQVVWPASHDRPEIWYVHGTKTGWTSPLLVGRGRMAELSIDASGRQHVVMAGGDRVVHRWRRGDGWERRIIADSIRPASVDIRAFGRRASIAWAQEDAPRGVWVTRD